MEFSEFETKRFEKIMGDFIEKRRPPLHLREEVDIAFRIIGQSIELFEIREHPLKPKEKMEQVIAKTKFIKSKKVWKLYWQRADLKWHAYEPKKEIKRLEEFIEIVDADQYGCFWG